MKLKFLSRLPAISAALAALIFSCVDAQAQYHYMYNGKKMTLNAASGRVAVRATVANAAQAQSVAAGVASVSTTDTRSLGVSGWSVVNAAASKNSALRSAAASAQNTATTAVQSLAASTSVSFAAPVFTDGDSETIPTSEILVGLTSGTTIQAVLASLKNANITGSIQLAGETYKLTTNLKNGLDVLNLANSLNGKSGIAFAEPNFIQTGTTHAVPTDPFFSDAWGLRNTGLNSGKVGFDMGATTAWDATMGSSSVVVVVFECGIDPSHPDINAISGRDFTNAPVTGAGPRPTGNEAADNHGTHVAGCISGKANNGIGACGVAPNVRIASARIGVPTSGIDYTSQNDWIVSALDWSRTIGARVTNHSYGMKTPSSAVDAALQRARNAGIVNVAATGNKFKSYIDYPASSPYCLAVGAATRNGTRADFSNYGAGIDFLAPGKDIVTTDRVGSKGANSGDYAIVEGTSFASPYAAGVAALIISRYPTWSASQVEQRMMQSCIDMGTTGYDTQHGYGLINAALCLGLTLPPSDDHGDTTAKATSIVMPSTTSGVINNPADIDVFRFTVATGLEATITTTGNTDTRGEVFSSSGKVIGISDNPGGSLNFRVDATLSAGTYYVNVWASSYTAGRDNTYNLVLSYRPLASPEIRMIGNNKEIANRDTTPTYEDNTSFGQVTKSGSVVDRIFVINNIGTGDLRLTGSPAVVLSGSGASQFKVMTQPATTLAVGRSTNFTVRFAPQTSGTFNATLSIASNDFDENPTTFAIIGIGPGTSTTVPGASDDHGDTTATATNASIPGSASGKIDHVWDKDYYRFTLSTTTKVTLSGTGSTMTDGLLYTSAGTAIAASKSLQMNGGFLPFKVTQTLAAGTYYLAVSSSSNYYTGAYGVTFSR